MPRSSITQLLKFVHYPKKASSAENIRQQIKKKKEKNSPHATEAHIHIPTSIADDTRHPSLHYPIHSTR